MAKPKVHTEVVKMRVSPDLLSNLKRASAFYEVPVATYVRSMFMAAMTLKLQGAVMNEQVSREELLSFLDANR